MRFCLFSATSLLVASEFFFLESCSLVVGNYSVTNEMWDLGGDTGAASREEFQEEENLDLSEDANFEDASSMPDGGTEDGELAPDSVQLDQDQLTDNDSTLVKGLVGWWKMDEAHWVQDCNTTSVKDSSGEGNDGRSCPGKNGPDAIYDAGIGRNVGEFDGADDFVEVLTNQSQMLPEQMTISLWLELDQTAQQKGLDIVFFRKDSTIAPWHSYQLYQTTADDICFDWINEFNQELSQCSKTKLSTSTWYHIAAVKDTNSIDVYINGTIDSVMEVTTSGSLFKSDGNLTIGGLGGGEKNTHGRIFDVRLYGRALSADEVLELRCLGGECGL